MGASETSAICACNAGRDVHVRWSEWETHPKTTPTKETKKGSRHQSLPKLCMLLVFFSNLKEKGANLWKQFSDVSVENVLVWVGGLGVCLPLFVEDVFHLNHSNNNNNDDDCG